MQALPTTRDGPVHRRRLPPDRVGMRRVAGRRGSQPGDARALRVAARLLDRAEERARHLEFESVETLIGRAESLGNGDDACLARALTLRIRVHRIRDRFDESMQSARVAIRLWQSLGDRGGEAAVRTQITHILLAVGNIDEALSEGLTAMSLADSASDAGALVEALRVVGCVYLAVAQFDRAAAFCERGIETSRRIGDAISEGALLDTLGCVFGTMAYAARAGGDDDRARALHLRSIDLSAQAMTIARACGHRANEATAVSNVAEGLLATARPEEALALMESSAIASSAPGGRAAHYLDTRGSICLALGRVDDAIDLFQRAHATATSSNCAMAALEHAAEAYERKGDPTAALAYYKRYHALFRQVMSEKAQRSASVAAVRLETQQARASANASRSLAEDLQRSNEQLSRRAEDLMHDSLHDALTGLGNRRLMERLLDAGTPRLALALIDVDRFKAINDGWSHLIGDHVLRELAGLLRGCCGPTDTPIRYGGEEFAILLRDRDERTAVENMERVRGDIAAYDWSRVASGLSVTVSIGVAFGFEAGGPSSMLELADRRLYDAKNSGRDRVIARSTVAA